MLTLLSGKSGLISFSLEESMEQGYHPGMKYFIAETTEFTLRLHEFSHFGFQAELITLQLHEDDQIFFGDLPIALTLLFVFRHSIQFSLSHHTRREIHDRSENLFYSANKRFNIRLKKNKEYLLILIHYFPAFLENHLEQRELQNIRKFQNAGFYNKRSRICLPETLHLLSKLMMTDIIGSDDNLWVDELARALLIEFLEEKTGEYQPGHLGIEQLETFYADRERIVEAATLNLPFSKLLAIAGIKDVYIFRKKLSQLYGLNIRDFIIETRMAKAADLLKDPTFSVKEVATLVGFKNAFYFSRVFTRYFGQPPKLFRS